MVSKTLFSSNTDEWQTPIEFYKILNNEFHFQTDPCTTKNNPLETECFFTKEDEGLIRIWNGNVFINPPYSQIKDWVREISFRHEQNVRYNIQQTIVLLIPSRTDTRWFHQYIYQKYRVEIRFIKGRLKFRGATNSAPFPSLIAIFR